MIINPLIKKAIVKNIIAPHGITDIIHSVNNNTTKKLLFINSATCSSSIFFNNDLFYDNGINIIFLLTSIIHFRHDMPYISNIPRYIISSILLLSIYYNHDIFYLYMTCLHVPNHYKFNYKYIKKNIFINIFLIGLFTYGINILDNYILYTSFIRNIIKNIVISHILYQELYVHN